MSDFSRPPYGDKDLSGRSWQKWFSAVQVALSKANPPVTYSANFTVGTGDKWIINNKAGSACIVTLPVASEHKGRELYFVNYKALAVTSASSNVVPLGGGAAGTAILAGTVGAKATLVSNGTNWIIMQ